MFNIFHCVPPPSEFFLKNFLSQYSAMVTSGLEQQSNSSRLHYMSPIFHMKIVRVISDWLTFYPNSADSFLLSY